MTTRTILPAPLSQGTRRAIVVLAVLAIVSAAATVIFAATACPADLPAQPCPGAGTNRLIVIMLAAVTAALVVVPFAFLAEFVLRRRIEYRGAWSRAARRGLLVGAVVITLAGLRLGGALSIPVAIFAILLAAAGEWFAIRRLDLP
jgi:hypothetical protein